MSETDFTIEIDLSDIRRTPSSVASHLRAEPDDADGDRLPPVLPAERLTDGSGRVKVYCRYCAKFHYHGEPTGDGTRNRVAHCAAETPYKRGGYILHIVEPGFYDAETLLRLKGGRR